MYVIRTTASTTHIQGLTTRSGLDVCFIPASAQTGHSFDKLQDAMNEVEALPRKPLCRVCRTAVELTFRREESAPWDDAPTARQIQFPATHKQINYLLKLSSERGVSLVGIVCEADPMDPSKPYIDPATGEFVPKIDKRDASAKISVILNGPMPTTPKPASPAPIEVTEGMYQSPDGEIFKVQIAVHGSGKLYAKKLVTETDENNVTTAWFSYAAGAVRKLKIEWKMTHDQAAEFGSLYGICCCCSKTLTHEDSQHNGYGKKCAGNNGWPYEKAPKMTITMPKE